MGKEREGVKVISYNTFEIVTHLSNVFSFYIHYQISFSPFKNTYFFVVEPFESNRDESFK